MDVNDRLVAALEPFGDPVWFGVYRTEKDDKRAERYYTYNYTTFGADHRDNEPRFLKHLVQVHFFCPLSFRSVSRARQTRKALRDAGFTFPSTVNATDTDGQHIIFECEYVEEADYADA